MTLITIREKSQTAEGFEAELILEGRDNYPISITNPFEEYDEQLLSWYFEDWLNQPHLNQVRAEEAKASVKTYGQKLFKQVFQADINAYSQYQQCRGDLSQIQIQIESKTPDFQSLHWEALQDPDLPRPLAVDCIVIRKNIQPAPVKAEVKTSPTINLLVVIARPNGDEDVGYRTISRPLVEAIRNAELKVNIDLLRPGTYEALDRHLTAKGNGYYHIVHFDTHGSLMEYEHIEAGIQNNRYIYQQRFGRNDIQPYEGVEAFIFLEGETKGEADPVKAEELAALLTGKGIPVCILNACQSGKQLQSPLTPLDKGGKEETEDSRETSLGSRLMTAGMDMVVAMGYSVTVTAARILMEQVYSHLFESSDFNQAILLGRRELWNRKTRQANYNFTIDLEDWMLPVVYFNQEVKLNLRDFTPEEEEAYYDSIDSKYQFTPPAYGFIGRDLDILYIEKALLKHNILLLRGMGGTGKTTLLNYLREWWQTTNFTQNVFYFGYDERAWTLEQITFEIGKQLYKRFEFANFQAMNPRARTMKLVAKLRAESYTIILDNLESVTGQPLAIQNTLEETERELIRDFLAKLVKGNTKIVLGSRSGGEWLQATTFKDNSYQLRGLDPQARSVLAEKILKSQVAAKRIPQIREDEQFLRLMKLLAGYPLAMEVVFSNLKHQSPQEILEQLEAAEIDPGGEDKTNNIIKCIDYSHSNLSPQAQKLLLCLAPFRGFIFRGNIPEYAEALVKLEPFQEYDLEQLGSAVAEATNWGLLAPMDTDYPQLLTIQPVLPYFLQTKLKEKDELTRQALREGFKNHYQELARSYFQFMESKIAEERNLGIAFVKWEYENLYQALQICLEQQQSVCDIWNCLDKYLDVTSNRSRQLQLNKAVYDTLSAYTPEQRASAWEQDIIPISGNLATCYGKKRDYKTAQEIYQESLTLIPQMQSIKESQKQSYLATTYHNLGNVTYKLRQYQQAQEYYQQALALWIEYGDRYSQAITYHQLGMVAQKLRQYQQAQKYYQQALEIQIEYGDRYKQATTYHELGIVAQQLRQYQQAQEYYQQALALWIEYGDSYSQAHTYHQLGMVAQELRQYQQAESYYQQALEIKIEYGDRYKQATTYHQLGMVAVELRQYQQAQSYYQQALEIYIEYGDRLPQASTYHQLGMVAEELSQFQQAEAYYQQALAIKIEYGDRYSQARTYGQLGLLAQELGDFESAKTNLLQALAIFAEFQDQNNLERSVGNLASLYRQIQDESFLAEAATILNITPRELKELFEQFNSEDS
ncbi:MAG: tetratricopeptide repeat protein [Xenococcaceae cyanobacterium MO_167.B52]|nr:tetratricopeptide repeat protein [Xenococcaceae cyanobacterium MO_167.B52]